MKIKYTIERIGKHYLVEYDVYTVEVNDIRDYLEDTYGFIRPANRETHRKIFDSFKELSKFMKKVDETPDKVIFKKKYEKDSRAPIFGPLIAKEGGLKV